MIRSHEQHERPLTTAWPRVGVPLGAGLFICALIGSAIIVPQLRALHFFQALLYVAVIVLARRGSAWGFGAGVSVPLVWNVMEVFPTHLLQAGVAALWLLLRTGQATRIDTMMVPLGWLGHCVLIVSCAIGIAQRRSQPRAWAKFAGGFAASLAYFAFIVATLLPH